MPPIPGRIPESREFTSRERTELTDLAEFAVQVLGTGGDPKTLLAVMVAAEQVEPGGFAEVAAALRNRPSNGESYSSDYFADFLTALEGTFDAPVVEKAMDLVFGPLLREPGVDRSASASERRVSTSDRVFSLIFDLIPSQAM